VIYVVPENTPQDQNDWRVVIRCTDHRDYSCTFPGQGPLANAVPAGSIIIEMNEHIRLSHIALPAQVA
jgi:hypothetical protein